jgi:hypothetical protein
LGKLALLSQLIIKRRYEGDFYWGVNPKENEKNESLTTVLTLEK